MLQMLGGHVLARVFPRPAIVILVQAAGDCSTSRPLESVILVQAAGDCSTSRPLESESSNRGIVALGLAAAEHHLEIAQLQLLPVWRGDQSAVFHARGSSSTEFFTSSGAHDES
jgi:hypothetical protein